MASTQLDSCRPRPKVLRTISGNIHFYERSESSRQARRALPIQRGSRGHDSQSRRASTSHSSLNYFIPSTRPSENTKSGKDDQPKPVFLERYPTKNGSASLESCPAFDFLQPIKWKERPKDETSPEHHGWERIAGMLSSVEFASEKYKQYRRRDRRGRDKTTNAVIWTHENEDAFQMGLFI